MAETRVPIAAPPLRWVAGAAAIVFAIAALFSIVGRIDTILFLAFFGIVLAAILSIPVAFLARWMPRPVAAVVTLVGAMGILAGLVVLAAPTVEEQARRLVEQAPRALDRVEGWIARSPVGVEQIEGHLAGQARALLGRVVPFATGLVSAIAGIVVLVILAAFLAAEPGTYLRAFLRLIPREHEETAAELLRRCGRALRAWMVGTLILMTAVAGMTALGLLVLDVETWLILAVIIFFTEFIPYIGPVLGGIPAVLVALSHSPTKALWVLGLYVVIQQIENNVLQPMVMRREAAIHPALLIVWQLVIGAAFGFIALIVATPLLACLQEAVGYLWVERALGKRVARAGSPRA